MRLQIIFESLIVVFKFPISILFLMLVLVEVFQENDMERIKLRKVPKPPSVHHPNTYPVIFEIAWRGLEGVSPGAL